MRILRKNCSICLCFGGGIDPAPEFEKTQVQAAMEKVKEISKDVYDGIKDGRN